MLGYVRAFEDGLVARLAKAAPQERLTFESWTPARHAITPKSTTAPHLGRWAWDFLPLLATTFRWWTDESPRPGAFRVGLRVELDGGWRNDGREPDPTTFAAVETCESPVAAWIYRVDAVRGAATWNDVESAITDPKILDDGQVHEVRDAGVPDFVVRKVVTDLVHLPGRDEVERRLVDPLARVIGL
ncbi:hypothetical protein L6R52_19245 [Myxococcota bacterium]|nr:hypothetical protein [Myxococcota bacterium]